MYTTNSPYPLSPSYTAFTYSMYISPEALCKHRQSTHRGLRSNIHRSTHLSRPDHIVEPKEVEATVPSIVTDTNETTITPISDSSSSSHKLNNHTPLSPRMSQRATRPEIAFVVLVLSLAVLGFIIALCMAMRMRRRSTTITTLIQQKNSNINAPLNMNFNGSHNNGKSAIWKQAILSTEDDGSAESPLDAIDAEEKGTQRSAASANPFRRRFNFWRAPLFSTTPSPTSNSNSSSTPHASFGACLLDGGYDPLLPHRNVDLEQGFGRFGEGRDEEEACGGRMNLFNRGSSRARGRDWSSLMRNLRRASGEIALAVQRELMELGRRISSGSASELSDEEGKKNGRGTHKEHYPPEDVENGLADRGAEGGSLSSTGLTTGVVVAATVSAWSNMLLDRRRRQRRTDGEWASGEELGSTRREGSLVNGCPV